MLAQNLKGFRDFLPVQARKRLYLINILRSVFESYGFEPLETPALEYEEVLLGKYGEEGDKLMYRFEDLGKRRVAMRYDQTVPLARVVAQYQNELPFPFKRYQIQPVWRAENTQHGRFREFTQIDADIVGISSPIADAEVVATAVQVLRKLGFKNFKVFINDRKIFSQMIERAEMTQEEMGNFVRAIDKLKKIGEEGVIAELASKNIPVSRAKELMQLLHAQEETETIQDVRNYLANLEIEPSQIHFEKTLARGLDYYTGIIFEIEIEEYSAGSVAGGGRYDNLIGIFAGRQIPAVGFAFGFDRLMEAMEELNLFPPSLLRSSSVLVTVFNKDLVGESIKVVNVLRENGINAQIYESEHDKLEKQLKYANKKSMDYVVVIGPDEAEKGIVTVKNFSTSTQETIPLAKLPEFIKK